MHHKAFSRHLNVDSGYAQWDEINSETTFLFFFLLLFPFKTFLTFFILSIDKCFIQTSQLISEAFFILPAIPKIDIFEELEVKKITF